MVIDPTPMRVTARVLNPPTLRYGGDSQPTIVRYFASSLHLLNMFGPSRDLRMVNGTCRNYTTPLVWYLTRSIRRDKKLYKTEIIKKWVIVIFETERFFNDGAVSNMISGFIQGAQSVGECSHFVIIGFPVVNV